MFINNKYCKKVRVFIENKIQLRKNKRFIFKTVIYLITNRIEETFQP